MRVLCTTDGSPPARRAGEFLGLANKERTEATIGSPAK
jgi:hypothetical protein